MEYSIQEVARAAGTTSRTLRHYGELGLVRPSRIGQNGYRYYDELALVRLQRVLLLRELGLGLEAIGRVLEAQDREAGNRSKVTGQKNRGQAEAEILRQHLELLGRERTRLDAQIAAVERTVAALEDGELETAAIETTAPTAQDEPHREKGDLMSQNMFDGFDHTQYREEVEAKWGAETYAKSDRWWRALGAEGQEDWKQRVMQLNADWIAAYERGDSPTGAVAQEIASRHVNWLAGVPGRPEDLRGYVAGLAEMYVADQRFAANYGGTEGATFVRDALTAFVEEEAL